ncbi:MAG: GNAT family N-acetyltransferase [Phototrophicales bacterium]|nr:GNAT family N-acetyltransferase [Phototrophicales bacterium]
MIEDQIRIIPYTRGFRPTFNDMMFFSNQMHLHLDWSHIDTWIHSADAVVLVAVKRDRILGFLGASRPIMGQTWVRMAVFKDDDVVIPAIITLWDSLKISLSALGTTDVYWMIFDNWLNEPLTQLGFIPTDEVITFIRYNAPILIPKTRFTVHSANMNDIDRLFAIDKEAFSPMWQMTHEDMRHARRAAAICTMAMDGDEVVGFQLSTLHHHNGHLARLAVLPSKQGQGIGKVLVSDLVRYFIRRHIDYVSVNTQLSNPASQQLYNNLGFIRNGYDMPVWKIKI